MDEINLYTAFGWICSNCQAQNYCDGVILELTDEDIEEAAEDFREEFGEELADNDWIQMPNIVKCKECSTKYKVDQGLDEYDDI